MKANNFDWLPAACLLLAVGLSLALRSEPRHETCNNEKRYENQVMCAGVQFGYRAPYPDNCSLFLVCDCLYPTVQQCPANLWWNNRTQNCDWPQDTECFHYSIAQTTEVIPTSTGTDNWTTTSYDPPAAPPGIEQTICENSPDGTLYAYPYDCNAYINCTYGWPVLNYCDPDKVFNALLLICDTPDTAHCEPLPLPSTTTSYPTDEPTTPMGLTTTTAIATTFEPTSTTEDGQCGAPPLGIDEDYCWNLGNGFYEYPFDCSAYIRCRNGCTNLDYCIPDKLFNPLLHICDTPSSVNCNPSTHPTTTTPGSTADTTSSSSGLEPSTTESSPSTSTSTSTSSSTSSSTSTAGTPTTPSLPADVDPNLCRDKTDYTRYPYAANCSEFLHCKDNQVVVGHCAPNLLFNPDLLICDTANDVICYGDRTTTPMTTTPMTTSPTEAPTTTTERTTVTTTTPATTPGPAELCAGQPVGTSYPYVQDCAYYILCLGDDEFYIAPCISNTYFDPKTGQCEQNVSPTACREVDTTTTTTTTTTPPPTTTTEVVSSTSTPTTSVATTTSAAPRPAGGICGDRDEGEMIAYPSDCSKYIVCVSPIPVGFYCTPGSYFSAKQQMCVSWEESDCDKDTATTPGHTQAPLEPTMCTNSSRDTFPYPENCQWFIRCVDDYIYMMDVCNCGEYYDPISGKCGADVPPDACRWDYTSTTTTEATAATETTTTPAPTPPVTRPPPQQGPCDDAADGELVPYPNDCSKYIKCDRPIAAAYDCPAGEEFSPEARQCMESSLANCTAGTTPNPAEPTTPSWPGSTTASDETTDSTATTLEDSSTQAPTTAPEVTITPEPETTTKADASTTEPSTSTGSTLGTTAEPTSTPAPPGGICGGKPNGVLVPYPSNCSKYIVCEQPIPIGYDCPEGLEFSPTELQCMDPNLANCVAQQPTTPATTTSPITTPQLPTTADSSSAATEPPTTEGTPIITESSSTVTTPESTQATETVTPTGTESTTPASSTADTESTISSSSTAVTEPTTVTPTESPTESTTAMSPETSSTVIDTTIPVPSTASPSTTSEATPPTSTTIHPDTPNICCGRPLGTILPYPNDCNRYVVCDYPIPYAVACEEGTLFDSEYLQCAANSTVACI